MSAERPVRIALAQVDCTLGAIEKNASRALEAIGRARELGAQLVVFPELSLTGYSLDAVPDDIALRPDDPVLTALARDAGGMAVVIGFVERGPVHTHNSAAYLEAGRVAHVQRKAFLPTYGRFEEHKHFSAGQGLRAFDTSFGRAALLICNDMWQAPVPFLVVQDGAEVLIVPACSGVGPDADGETEDDWAHLLRFHARFHETFVVFVNRVGSEDDVRFWGGSRLVDPWGRVVAEAPRHEPALITADVDLLAVRRRRRAQPLLKEPRLELLARELGRLMDGD